MQIMMIADGQEHGHVLNEILGLNRIVIDLAEMSKMNDILAVQLFPFRNMQALCGGDLLGNFEVRF
jgi:hypothetical protein